MSGQSVMASPQIAVSVVDTIAAAAINSGQKVDIWWHSSRWAARSARFVRENFSFPHSSKQQPGWDGIGAPDQPMPKPEPQETQEERNARVVRLEIHPKEITVRPDMPVNFSVIGYDSNNSPVGGLQFDWSSEEETSGKRVNVTEIGKFSASREGSYKVRASMNGRAVETMVKVKGERFAPGEQPIGTNTVSSRDLPSAPRSSSALPKTKERIAKNALSRLSTKFASAGTKAMPAILQAVEDLYGWNSSNYMTADDPGKQRGNPPGHTPDGGTGSANFQFATPVLPLDGRGLDVNLGLAYNSRVWHKANSEITFDIDRDWPAPGWSLGFGKILSMGLGKGFMLIDADGTRHPYIGTVSYSQFFHGCTCKTSDGSFIDYTVADNTPGGSTLAYAYAHLPNGTQILYEAPGANAVYPTWIGDSNGNRILITYRNNQGPQINTITDTLGRVIQFYYDSNNLLVAITGPGFNGTTRTLVRLTYEWKNLANLGANYGFVGLTPRVRNNVIPVIKAIYYPSTNTGYWFGDSDSYSAYGMLAKVIEQRGMGFFSRSPARGSSTASRPWNNHARDDDTPDGL